MKKSTEERIESLEKQVRLCSVVSIAAIVVIVLLFGAEYIVADCYKSAGWAKDVLRVCRYALLVMPYVVVIPLFVRVNLKGKLQQEKNSKF